MSFSVLKDNKKTESMSKKYTEEKAHSCNCGAGTKSEGPGHNMKLRKAHNITWFAQDVGPPIRTPNVYNT